MYIPTPTNEYQKAICEQAKADKERGPTNPIKIPMPKPMAHVTIDSHLSHRTSVLFEEHYALEASTRLMAFWPTLEYHLITLMPSIADSHSVVTPH